jgi:hypothetical protein
MTTNCLCLLTASFLTTALALPADTPLIPIGAFQEYLDFPTPEIFDDFQQHPSGSFLAYTASGGSTRVYKSADARTWTLQTTLFGVLAQSMATSASGTMIVGNAGAAFFTADGNTWSDVSHSLTSNLSSVVVKDGAFYSLATGYGSNQNLMCWNTAAGWSHISTLPDAQNRLVATPGVLLAYSSWATTPLVKSADGTAWTNVTIPERPYQVVTGDGMLLAGRYQSTDDAETWTYTHSYSGQSVAIITFGGSRVVVSHSVTFLDTNEPWNASHYFGFAPKSVRAISNGIAVTRNDQPRIYVSRQAETIPVITTEPQDESCPITDTFGVETKAVGGQLSYQWYEGESGDTSRPLSSNRRTLYMQLRRQMRLWCRVSNTIGYTDTRTASIRGFVFAYGQVVYETLQSNELIPLAYALSNGEPVRWTKNGLPVAAGRTNELLRAAVSLEDAGSYVATVIVDGRSYASEPVSVGVVRAGVTIAGVTPEGTSVKIRQVAAGPSLGYLWSGPEHVNLEDSAHFQGTTSSTLSINNIRPEHEGWYHCYVFQLDSSGQIIADFSGLRHYVTVEPLPAIDEYELPHEAMVSRSMSMVPCR